jgi:hypothetical protein
MNYHDRNMVRLRDGTLRPLAPGEILPDGASFFVPLTLRDQAIGGLSVTAAETLRAMGSADAAWMSMVRDVSTAWMPPPAIPLVPIAAGVEAADAAFQAAVARLRDAWRC